MTMKQMVPVICAEDLGATRKFYTQLLGFNTALDAEWFVRLTCPDIEAVELLIYQHGHAEVPERFCSGEGGGLYLSLEVDNVDAIWKRARDSGIRVLKQPGHDDYDRRNIVLQDPSGTILEIFTRGDPEEAAKSELMRDY